MGLYEILGLVRRFIIALFTCYRSTLTDSQLTEDERTVDLTRVDYMCAAILLQRLMSRPN